MNKWQAKKLLKKIQAEMPAYYGDLAKLSYDRENKDWLIRIYVEPSYRFYDEQEYQRFRWITANNIQFQPAGRV